MIKFKAKIKEENRTIDVKVIDWNNMTIDGNYPDIEIKFEDVILLQSNGLLDENGEEIYNEVSLF